MRKNKFSSAADRRWQQRYERIQQRKEEERRQEELKEQFDYDQLSNGLQQIRYIRGADIRRFDISEPAVATAPTYTITIPEPDLIDWFDAFVDVKDIGLGDRTIFSFDMSLAPDIQEAELDTGDTDILDSFLGEFLLQGA